MTQVERLIRNLCEERRLQLIEQEKAALKRVPEKTEWKHLPAKVRSWVVEYRQAEDRQVAIKAQIEAAGFQAYNLHRNRALLLRDRDDRYARERQIHQRRRERVGALRTSATIETLGKSATEAQRILKVLQADLAKV